jgi:hypothetical protein
MFCERKQMREKNQFSLRRPLKELDMMHFCQHKVSKATDDGHERRDVIIHLPLHKSHRTHAAQYPLDYKD